MSGKIRRPIMERALRFIRRKTGSRFVVVCHATPRFERDEQVGVAFEVSVGQNVGLGEGQLLELGVRVERCVRRFLVQEGFADEADD